MCINLIYLTSLLSCSEQYLGISVFALCLHTASTLLLFSILFYSSAQVFISDNMTLWPHELLIYSVSERAAEQKIELFALEGGGNHRLRRWICQTKDDMWNIFYI